MSAGQAAWTEGRRWTDTARLRSSTDTTTPCSIWRNIGRAGEISWSRSDDGHLDLPRAREGGLIGGLFAMFAKPDRPPVGDLTKTATGYEVRLADPLDPAFARRRIDAQLDELSRVVDRSAGQIRWAATVDEIEAARRDGVFVMVLHMEGAEAIGPDLENLDRLYAAGLRSLGLGLEQTEYLWEWRAVRVPAVAGHRTGPYRRGQGAGAGVQPAWAS